MAYDGMDKNRHDDLAKHYERLQSELDKDIIEQMRKAELPVPIPKEKLVFPDFSKKVMDKFPSLDMKKIFDDIKKGIFIHDAKPSVPPVWHAGAFIAGADPIEDDLSFILKTGTAGGSMSGPHPGHMVYPAYPAGPAVAGSSAHITFGPSTEVTELQVKCSAMEAALSSMSNFMNALHQRNEDLQRQLEKVNQDMVALRDEIEMVERERVINEKYEREQAKNSSPLIQPRGSVTDITMLDSLMRSRPLADEIKDLEAKQKATREMKRRMYALGIKDDDGLPF